MDGEILLGTFVRTKRRGHRGVVIGKYITFRDSGASEDWFKGQQPRISEDKMEMPWIDILSVEYGSVLVPISDCELTEPFWMDNPLVEFYFGTRYQLPGIPTPRKNILKSKTRMLRLEAGGIE